MDTESAPGRVFWSDEDDRPRVLVECTDAAMHWAIEHLLRDNGYDVATCAGPDALGPAGCPLLRTGRCEMVEQAELVVHALDLGGPEGARVLAAERACYPSTPVVVEATRPQMERHAELLETTQQLVFPMTSRSLLAAVARNLPPRPPCPEA